MHAQFGQPDTLAFSEVPSLYAEARTVDLPILDRVDLDGDGLLDILTYGLRSGDYQVRPVWFKCTGIDSYEPARSLPSQALSSFSLLAFDADGDDRPDVLGPVEEYAVNDGEDVAYAFGYYRNLGAGMFADEPVRFDTVVVGTTWDGCLMKAADLDGDGRKDLVVSASVLSMYRSLWWYRSGGTNGMEQPRSIVNSGAAWMTSFDTGDLDGDGDVDIAYAYEVATGGATNLIGYRANQGTGTFGPFVQLTSTGYLPSLLRLEDTDQNGGLDIVCAAATTDVLRIFPNDGTAQFGPYTEMPTGLTDADELRFMDVDGDTQRDLLLSSSESNYTLLFPHVGGGFGAVPDTVPVGVAEMAPWSDPSSGRLGYIGWGRGGVIRYEHTLASDAWHLTQVSTQVPDQRHFTDVDGDGLPDILFCNGWGALSWMKNQGDLTFSRSSILSVDLDRFSTDQTTPQLFVTEDMDGDGDADLVMTSRSAGISNDHYDGLAVLPAIGPGIYGAPLLDLHGSGVEYKDIQVADVDADGDLDLVYSTNSIVIRRNDGAGVFMAEVKTIASLGSAHLLDWSEDGLPDLVYTAGGRLWRMRNLGTSFGEAQSMMTITAYVPLRAVDVDVDGRLDIVYELDWYRNLGGGDFAAAQHIAQPISYATWIWADADLDGATDLFAFSSAALYYSRNLGGGAFEMPNAVLGGSVGGSSTDKLVLERCVDLDNDGDPEIVTAIPWAVVVLRNYASDGRFQGHLFIDVDADGQRDAGEPPAPWMSVQLSPAGAQQFTGADGGYVIYADPGEHTLHSVSDWMPGYWQLTVGADGYTRTLTGTEVISGLDFGLAPVADSSALVPNVVLGTGPCGGEAPLWLTLANEGTRIERGTVQVDLGPLCAFVSSTPAPLSIAGSVITWAFDSLSLFEERTITATIVLPSVAHQGDSLHLPVVVTTLDDQGTADGTFTTAYASTVACSYDPNDKQVSPQGYGAVGGVDIATDHLDYTIRFQNTGSAVAYNVELRDRLPAALHQASVHVLGYSHPPTRIRIDADGTLVVRFDNILLPDSGTDLNASQGFITFRIGVRDGLADLTPIANSAGIFFDLNEPVITDTVLNTLVDCSAYPAPTISDALISEGQLGASEGDAYQWSLDDAPIPGATSQTLLVLISGDYTVQVTNAWGCSRRSDAYALIATGVEAERSGLSFAVVPNPVTGSAGLFAEQALTAQDAIEVVDLNGRVVRSWAGNGSRTATITVEGLAGGLYVVRVRTPQGPQGSARIIVQ